MECHKCVRNCGNTHQGKKRSFWKWRTKKEKSVESPKIPKVALVGTPNVGKSVLFNALTGTYVTVSNYPGTTVEVSRGETRIGDRFFAIVDTPGMYSLLPITEEEKVARDLLFAETVDLVIHVIDAKNLGRMLPLTFQLIEAGLSVLLAVNMMDEAQRLGIQINPARLEKELGIPVVTMAAAQNVGISVLKERVFEYVKSDCLSAAY
ncbi:50S ribosome-binding GTPase [Planktothrix sp. FACHB-1355]|uniref:50S ribosome-binding GTPase n=1 Tax=Aerosakkonema funiforme FACHB-1375 TaxID=2949571 RepID=A0A926VIA0_9CYAN|nr:MULTISPECIES: FeoB small GTPase domain-containing protein [Oscillatoriales]MBD2184396.1 50S ribosome-binding GTPase [Aerosakkonema funiforme FACHB-1375]MBD3560587.1 50S ribosome-binding GTPase [Planktothrix sp. FACHB-1355]